MTLSVHISSQNIRLPGSVTSTGGSGALHRDLFYFMGNLDKSRPSGALPRIQSEGLDILRLLRRIAGISLWRQL